MTAATSNIAPELHALLGQLADEQLSDAGMEALLEMLRDSADARTYYLQYMEIHARLQWKHIGNDREEGGGQPRVFPSIGTRPARDENMLGTWAFSYMVASVFVCLLLIGFAAVQISHDHDLQLVDDNSRRSTTSGEASPHDRPALVFVGRVTGMAGAKWSDDPNYIAPMGIGVALGRTYKLKTGLMEITYDSGAKVILEGPCSYEVDSTAGGYLALGKLVARVEQKVASGQWPVARNEGRGTRDEGHESANPQSPIPTPQSLATSHQPLATNLSPLSPLPSPLFAVRTPTAIVTDLGTEFGVEVAINGDTTSHVFEGTVVIQAGIRGVGDAGMRDSDQRPATAVAGSKSDQSVALVAGQSVRVGRVCETHQEPATSAVVRFTQPTEPPQFARRLREPPKFIDLLDIVAGGDGTNGRRGRGISPADGRIMHEYVDARCLWIGQYNPVYAYRMIDGVFMPNGSNGQVQLDSAGHKFDGFPETLGRSWGSIWARAAKNESEQNVEEGWIYSITDLEDFTPDSRGLLAFCPNVGLTFDLEEVRKRYPEARLKGFHAVAGLASSSLSPPMADGRADLWIFVDGHLKYKRIGLARKDGPVEIDIELTDADHFLTLVSTDGGDGIIADWLVFGDPVLRISDAIE